MAPSKNPPAVTARRVYIDTGGLTCPRKGSKGVLEALVRSLKRAGMDGQVEVVARGCFGLCNIAPNMYVEPDGIWYSRFTLKDVPVIVRQHLRGNKPVTRLIHYPKRGVRFARPVQGGVPMPDTLVAREIEVGEVAPDFTLKDQDGNPVILSSFRGKKAVALCFYPFDWSPVCTTENCALTQDLGKFGAKETEVFGVSCDSHFSHKAWREKLGLEHSLLSDQKREVAKKYGLYLEELNCSKRATVVVDKGGQVVFKKVQEIKVPRSNEEILGAIR